MSALGTGRGVVDIRRNVDRDLFFDRGRLAALFGSQRWSGPPEIVDPELGGFPISFTKAEEWVLAFYCLAKFFSSCKTKLGVGSELPLAQ